MVDADPGMVGLWCLTV